MEYIPTVVIAASCQSWMLDINAILSIAKRQSGKRVKAKLHDKTSGALYWFATGSWIWQMAGVVKFAKSKKKAP